MKDKSVEYNFPYSFSSWIAIYFIFLDQITSQQEGKKAKAKRKEKAIPGRCRRWKLWEKVEWSARYNRCDKNLYVCDAVYVSAHFVLCFLLPQAKTNMKKK